VSPTSDNIISKSLPAQSRIDLGQSWLKKRKAIKADAVLLSSQFKMLITERALDDN
jgi:hypothetical protein